jgi:hypothetical protein
VPWVAPLDFLSMRHAMGRLAAMIMFCKYNTFCMKYQTLHPTFRVKTRTAHANSLRGKIKREIGGVAAEVM